MLAQSERRSEPRIEIPLVSYVLVGREEWAARLIDLSCSGARLELVGDGQLPSVHTIVVDFATGDPVRILARVVRRTGPHYAVEFVGLDELDRLAIAERMDSLARLVA
jgi:hypothetical protein